jgi:hypothetical protein
LAKHRESSLTVFAVWEPILATDWSAPGVMALRRLSDRRVRQYWDPNHLVAAAIKKAETAGALHPNCCERGGFPWDMAAAYAPGAQWGEIPPEPVFVNGPVVNSIIDLEPILTKFK